MINSLHFKIKGNLLLLCIFTLLIVVNILLGLKFFYKSDISIDDKNSSYKLQYHATPTFQKFIHNFQINQNSSLTPTTVNIKNINISLSDGTVASLSGNIPTVPIVLDTYRDRVDNISINARIDTNKAKKYKSSELSDLFFTMLIAKIITVTSTEIPIEERIRRINSTNKMLYEKNANPFFLIRK